MAEGFRVALDEMKKRGWPNVRHLYCRWHAYEAIKRHCVESFKRYPKGKQKAELHRFIDAFKNVVCAPNDIQMHTLWKYLEEGAGIHL